MDLEKGPDQRVGQKALDFLGGVPGVKSPLRMRYEAETKIFKDQHGNLENIRQKLGFSRRKMCQLLLVDPSAWTRWMKDESKVPPHIYRSLEWFLALNQDMLTRPDLAAIMTARYGRSTGAESAVNLDLSQGLADLREELKRQRLVSALLTSGLVLLAFVIAWLLYR